MSKRKHRRPIVVRGVATLCVPVPSVIASACARTAPMRITVDGVDENMACRTCGEDVWIDENLARCCACRDAKYLGMPR